MGPKMMKFNNSITLLISFSLLSLHLLGLSLALKVLVSSEIAVEWEACVINSASVSLLLVFDFMSVFFFSLVSLVAGGVLLFSNSYMSSETYFSRFTLLVLSFIFSMWMLIFSPNLISMLLGWDGLGVTSYLLVIYYQSDKSFNAGMLTALTNRIGDVLILISVGLMMSQGGWSFFYYTSGNSYSGSMGLFFILLALAAMTKSAQIPFSSWLPAAMAAPTPVSALVHSSTLVTAGVYLLIRFNYLLVHYNLHGGLLVVGLITMLLAGGSAVKEVDMKKVIALSTLSQLGVMFFSLGLALPAVAFFHLAAHAYFKAMLFMAAGSLIHSFNDYQDIRAMGKGGPLMPMSMSVVMVAKMSLMGLPFLSGFYSKDLILEQAMMSAFNGLVLIISLIATALTVIYSLRFIAMVMSTGYLGESSFSLAEMDIFMFLGMMTLLFPSIMGGLALSWGLFAFDSLVFLPLWLKLFILTMILTTLSACVVVMFSSVEKGPASGGAMSFMQLMWFMPVMFSPMASHLGLSYGKQLFKADVSFLPNLTFNFLVGSLENSQRGINPTFPVSFLSGLAAVLGLILLL